jgi:hypothetical protein
MRMRKSYCMHWSGKTSHTGLVYTTGLLQGFLEQLMVIQLVKKYVKVHHHHHRNCSQIFAEQDQSNSSHTLEAVPYIKINAMLFMNNEGQTKREKERSD